MVVIHRDLGDVFAVVLLGVGIDDVVGDAEIDGDEEVPGLDRHAVRVAGLGIDAEIDRAAVRGGRPLAGESGNHLHGLRMEGDQRHVDVVVEVAAEGVVGVVAEGADGRREGRDEAAEDAAFFRGGIADFRLVHAVFPNEVRRDIRRGSDLQEVAEGQAELPFFLIEAQRLRTDFQGGSSPSPCAVASSAVTRGEFLLGGCLLGLAASSRCSGCRPARSRRTPACARFPAARDGSRPRASARAEHHGQRDQQAAHHR